MHNNHQLLDFGKVSIPHPPHHTGGAHYGSLPVYHCLLAHLFGRTTSTAQNTKNATKFHQFLAILSNLHAKYKGASFFTLGMGVSSFFDMVLAILVN